ncbi:hypothetical protein BH23ACT5_BH23ACT5_22710 [soil metagenome]
MRDDKAPTTSPDPTGVCDHRLRTWGQTGVIACSDCGLVEWFGTSGPIDSAEAMAALFGSFDLIGSMPAIGAPAEQVLAYRPTRARRGALSVLPAKTWLQAGPDLWLATDGATLLLASPNQLMVDNLTRGA